MTTDKPTAPTSLEPSSMTPEQRARAVAILRQSQQTVSISCERLQEAQETMRRRRSDTVQSKMRQRNVGQSSVESEFFGEPGPPRDDAA